MDFLSKKNKVLRDLYQKKVKLSSKCTDQKKLISDRTKELIDIETNLEQIENEILKNELSNYFILLKDLKDILSKKFSEQDVEDIIQSVIKYADAIQTDKNSKKDSDVVLPVWTCTCEGRMNVCHSGNEDSPPDVCPIAFKSRCDGKRANIAFFKVKETPK